MANEETAAVSLEDKVENMFAGDVEDDTSNEPEQEYEADQEPELEATDEAEETEETEEKPEEGDETAEFIDVEYEGKLYSVPPELKDALLRTQDYTQKTQETAARRKEAEVVYGQALQSLDNFKFAESIQGDVLKAQQLDTQANQAKQYLRDNIDTLNHSDIEKIRLAVEDAENERNGIVQSIHGKRQAHQQAQQQSTQELLKKGTEVLRQNIPNWGAEAQSQVKEHVLSKGFTDAEVDTLLDPRMVEIAWEAAQYRALQEGKAAAVKKVVATPTIKSQSRNPMPEEVKAKLNLRKQLKNPKLSSKAKARKIQDAMGDRFG